MLSNEVQTLARTASLTRDRLRRRPLYIGVSVLMTIRLLVAATARMSFLPAPPWRLPVWLAIWFSPVLGAMAYDFRTRRLVHPVYAAGLAAFLLRALSPPFIVDTIAWSAFTRWVTALGGVLRLPSA